MKNRFFDIEELKSNTKQKDPGDKAAVLRDNFLSQHGFMVETLKELTGRLPSPGEFFALWTIKSFNAFTFIPYLIRELGKIDYLVLSTYSINIRIIDSLIKKIDQGKIDHVKLFIADSLKYRMPRVVDHLSAMVQTRSDKISVHFAWNHSKITLAQCGEQFFCIEGSGNWSENAQYEQYLFFNDNRLYNFRLNNITHDLYRRSD